MLTVSFAAKALLLLVAPSGAQGHDCACATEIIDYINIAVTRNQWNQWAASEVVHQA
jgi:hypothetical protein